MFFKFGENSLSHIHRDMCDQLVTCGDRERNVYTDYERSIGERRRTFNQDHTKNDNDISNDERKLIMGPRRAVGLVRSGSAYSIGVSREGGEAIGRMPNSLQKFAHWFFEEARVCPMAFISIRTFNARVSHRSSRTSWSIQLNFPQPIAWAFSPSAISTSHEFAFICDYLSWSKYCIQTRLYDGYSRCSLSDSLGHQLCMISGSKNVDYEQIGSMQSF